MSKLMTDSHALMDLLFEGCAPDDTPLYCTIDQLKNATLKAAEMRACVKYMAEEDACECLDKINTALVETWKLMLEIQNDFKDLIEEHFKRWQAQFEEGGVNA